MPSLWDNFYAQTQKLVDPRRTAGFLSHIPLDGQVLDFGCGTGRWALSFLRDRPDLTIDVLDQNLSSALLNSSDLNGEKFEADFAAFQPSKIYNGIWAYNALFFLAKDEVKSAFRKLARSLAPAGVISFTMTAQGEAAQSCGFSGLTKQGIIGMLGRSGFDLVTIRLDRTAEYGPQKIKVPTFHISAQKPDLG